MDRVHGDQQHVEVPESVESFPVQLMAEIAQMRLTQSGLIVDRAENGQVAVDMFAKSKSPDDNKKKRRY